MSILSHTVSILKKEQLNHDVFRFEIERPRNYQFTAGQAIELTLKQEKFLTDAAPFTLTGLNPWSVLEIIFKAYPDHNGITLAMSGLEVGDTLLISDAWDSFSYRKPGTFIAGGTGVTPFIAILRHLNQTNQLNGNKLIFANKTSEDIFFREELTKLLGNNFINILSNEDNPDYYNGRINTEFLSHHITDFDQAFYLCGPGNFSPDITSSLLELGAKKEFIISEY